jgi:hypothetical protein
MRNSLGERMHLLPWFHPLSFQGGPGRARQLIEAAADGSLERVAKAWAARGYLLPIEALWGATPESVMAVARTLSDAGLPLHLIVLGFAGGEQALWGKCDAWAGGNGHGALPQGWPCLPLADTSSAAGAMRNLAQRFRDQGLSITGVWADWEGLPHPWNGIYESQRDSADCRKHYPAGVLDRREAFIEYALELRCELLSQTIADPVHELFPDALVGNYNDCASSDRFPYVDYEGCRYPPNSLARLNTTMPIAYGLTRQLVRHFNDDWAVTQESADHVHFNIMLRSVSHANANKRPGMKSVPFVSRYLPESTGPRFDFGITQPLYREFIRHAILRGSDTFFVLNLGFVADETPSSVSPLQSFEAQEDVRAVLDELLDYRPFLEGGEPVCFDVPAMYSTGGVWSGLRLKDACLVRAAAMGKTSVSIPIAPFSDVAVSVLAPPDGATYLIRRGSGPSRAGTTVVSVP